MSHSEPLHLLGRSHRPTPFGPAGKLLSDRPLVSVREDEDLYSAISRLNAENYSQAPVIDSKGHVVGLFTERALADFIDKMGESKSMKMSSYKVDSVMQHDFTILAEDEFIADTVDWLQVHAVVVGTREKPVGILTVWDVYAHLNDFAEIFVLIFELELCLRKIITELLGDELEQELSEWTYPGGKPGPQALDEFTFSQYADFLFRKSIWPRFLERRDRNKSAIQVDLERAAEIRNQTVHFRKMASTRDTDALRSILKRFNKHLEAIMRSD